MYLHRKQCSAVLCNYIKDAFHVCYDSYLPRWRKSCDEKYPPSLLTLASTPSPTIS